MNKKLSKMSEDEQMEILCEQYKAIRRYLRACGLNDADFDDVLQETMMTVWRRSDTIRDMEKLDAWVRAIARNKVRKYYKANALEKERLWSYGDENWWMGESDGENPEMDEELKLIPESLIYEEMSRHEDTELYEMMQRLGEPACSILTLHYGYEETFSHISRMLGMKPTTVRSIASRAREKLKRIIVEEGSRYARGRIQEDDK